MTILWPPFVGWMFFCSLLFWILSRTRVRKIWVHLGGCRETDRTQPNWYWHCSPCQHKTQGQHWCGNLRTSGEKDVQSYTLSPSQKAHSLATSRDWRNKVLVTAPHLSSAPCSPPLPLLHTQAHEKAAMHTTREPMRTAAERKDRPKGRAWNKLFLKRI